MSNLTESTATAIPLPCEVSYARILVAVSTHARSGMSRVLRGANAASIVRASIAPCLVVPN